MLYAIIGMLVIIADQWIKFWVAGHLTLNEEIQTIIPGILSLVNVHNDGAAFGFLSGSGARIPFIILAGVLAFAVVSMLHFRDLAQLAEPAVDQIVSRETIFDNL